MKMLPISSFVKSFVRPQTIPFNPKRVVYEIGQTTMYADAGHGAVFVKDGIIYADRLKRLGVCTLGQESAPYQRIFIQNSDLVSQVRKREKDVVELRNCTFPSVAKPKPKVEHILNITYTNRV